MVEPVPQRRRRELAEEALGVARAAGDPRLEAQALMERALALSAEDAWPEVERAADALGRLGAVRTLAVLYWNAAYNAMKQGIHERAGQFIEAARPIVREIGDPWMTAYFCGNDGLQALFTGEVDRARAAFQDQIRLCVQFVAPPLSSEALGGLAAIATQRGEPERAARLLGAASTNGPIADGDVTRELEQRFFVPARARCDERRWDDAYASGRALTFHEAMALALDA
jgi:hypothetical protein